MLLRTTARVGRRVAEQTHAWKRFSTPAAAPDLPPPTSLSKAQALSSSRIVLDFVRLGVSGRRLDALAAAPEAPVADRWVQAMQVLVGAQAHTAAAFGYEASEKGIISYRHHLGLAAQGAGPDLAATAWDAFAHGATYDWEAAVMTCTTAAAWPCIGAWSGGGGGSRSAPLVRGAAMPQGEVPKP